MTELEKLIITEYHGGKSGREIATAHQLNYYRVQYIISKENEEKLRYNDELYKHLRKAGTERQAHQAHNALYRNGITSIEKLNQLSVNDIIQLKGIGVGTIVPVLQVRLETLSKT